MEIIKTKLEGVYIMEPRLFEDSRGWFMETYSQEKLIAQGIEADFIQDNHSFSVHQGTLRGLHLQLPPHAQTKLVRCTKGVILDVAVDLRADSPTYKEWLSVELSADNKKMLLIPKGFAHGFVTLVDNCEVQYKVDAYYSPEADRSIKYNDPEIGVDWGIKEPILSDKDAQAPLLKELLGAI